MNTPETTPADLASKLAGDRPAHRTVTLVVPLTQPDGSGQIDRVTLSRPNAGTLRGLKMQALLEMDVTAHATLLPRISSLTPGQVDELDPADLSEIIGTVLLFFATPAQIAQARAILATGQGTAQGTGLAF